MGSDRWVTGATTLRATARRWGRSTSKSLIPDDGNVSRPVEPDHFVFAITPEGIVVGTPDARELIIDLRGMDAEERESARYFAVDGEELDLVDPTGHGLWLVHSGRDGLADLRDGLARLANDPSANTDPRLAANEVLYNYWLFRWPSWPRWLHHAFHGRKPPTAKPD